ELGVEWVAGAMRDQVADDGIADQRQITDRVENLVADKLVFEPQGVVEDAGLAEHYRILERPAERQTVLPEHLDVLEERERPCRRDLLDERLLGDPQRAGLMPQERMVVADAVRDLEVIRRIERDAFVARSEERRVGKEW